MRFSTLAVVFFTALSAAPLAAQSTSNDTAAATAIVERFHAALKTGDAEAAAQLIADDALFLEAGGVETRSEYLTNHLPADIEFEKAVTTVRGPIRVVVAGDAAWATSTSEMTGTFQNRPVNSIGAELMVLSRQAGGVADQGDPLVGARATTGQVIRSLGIHLEGLLFWL